MPKNIPVKDADFDKKQELITAYVGQRLQAWTINSEWYTELLGAKLQ
jgi:hypothetical protein